MVWNGKRSRTRRRYMDYKVGQYVFHSHCGVCLVSDIAPLSPAEETLYYVLKPLYGEDKGNIVRVPVTFLGSLRAPDTRERAEQLVRDWPDIHSDLYIKDSKLRKAAYDKGLKSGLIEELAPLLEGAFQRKKRDGHLNSMDAMFVSRAAPVVYGELAFLLDIPYEEVPAYILEHSRFANSL